MVITKIKICVIELIPENQFQAWPQNLEGLIHHIGATSYQAIGIK